MPLTPPFPPPRRAEPSEAAALASLWLRSRAASVPNIPPPIHSDQEVARWFETVLGEREVWVVDSDHVVVALLVLEERWVDHLYVDPDWVGHGIGGQLLDFAKRLRPAGLDLWTFASNVDARRFYEHHGFVAVAASAGDNEEGQPDVRYHWSPLR